MDLKGYPNQLDLHTRNTLIGSLRFRINKLKLGCCGEKIIFEKNVQLLRFPKNIEIADRCHLKEGVKICACNTEAKIRIQKNTSIGYNTLVFSSENIEIGADCMIAPNVYIVDSDHGTDRRLPMRNQANVTDPVFIGNDVWIATGTIVLKGSFISTGCVIAANSVVKGKLEPYSIYAGSPVKKIGERL